MALILLDKLPIFVLSSVRKFSLGISKELYAKRLATFTELNIKTKAISMISP